MTLSPHHWVEWAYTCMEVLTTELGFYNITGNKDIQLQHSPRGPGAFPWMSGEDAFLQRPWEKPRVCSAPNPKMHHIFLLLVDGEKQKERGMGWEGQ